MTKTDENQPQHKLAKLLLLLLLLLLERLITAAAAVDIFVRNQSTQSRDKNYSAE